MGTSEESSEDAAVSAQADAIDMRALGEFQALMKQDTGIGLQSYLDAAALLMEQIEKAVQSGYMEGIATATHMLKSSSRQVGAGIVGNICAEMERIARANNETSPVACRQLFKTLSSAFQAAERSLTHHINTQLQSSACS